MDASGLDVKRHYHEPTEKEADRIVQVVAELIVDFLKGHRDGVRPAASESPHETTQKEDSE